MIDTVRLSASGGILAFINPSVHEAQAHSHSPDSSFVSALIKFDFGSFSTPKNNPVSPASWTLPSAIKPSQSKLDPLTLYLGLKLLFSLLCRCPCER